MPSSCKKRFDQQHCHSFVSLNTFFTVETHSFSSFVHHEIDREVYRRRAPTSFCSCCKQFLFRQHPLSCHPLVWNCRAWLLGRDLCQSCSYRCSIHQCRQDYHSHWRLCHQRRFQLDCNAIQRWNIECPRFVVSSCHSGFANGRRLQLRYWFLGI